MKREPVGRGAGAAVYLGDCRDILADMANDSIDAVITDPPYEMTSGRPGARGGFMGQAWDATGVAFSVELWADVLRVMKPGAHLLAFGAPRTWHRLAVAVEDAGFEIRDSIAWLNMGWPKSQNVEKEVARTTGDLDIASEFAGWGSALKPCYDPVLVARKPLDGQLAQNVLRYGTGGFNIDATRIPAADGEQFDQLKGQLVHKLASQRDGESEEEWKERIRSSPGQQLALTKLKELGRWPANVILDEGAAHLLDEQYARSGSQPSRFFYAPKAHTNERPKVSGVSHPTVKPVELLRYLIRLATPPEGVILDPFAGSGTTLEAAALEGFASIGIELIEEYIPLIEFRLDRVRRRQEGSS